MKKFFSVLVILLCMMLAGQNSVFAFTSLNTEAITASVTVGGTSFINVDRNTLTWPAINLSDPAFVNKWVAANESIAVNYLLPANGGIQVYTDNEPAATGGKAGLKGSTGPLLPTCWRATDIAPTASQKIIYAKVINETDIETTTGQDINGNGIIDPNVSYDLDGDGITTIGGVADYVVYLSDRADAYLQWDPGQQIMGRYACFIWMKDKDEVDRGGADPDRYDYELYTSIVQNYQLSPETGMQEAEMTFKSFATPPIYLTVGANFGLASAQTYTLSMVIELYNR